MPELSSGILGGAILICVLIYALFCIGMHTKISKDQMEFKAVYFDELSNSELFAILKNRMKVFIVEQHCPYQDIDDTDKESLHVFLKDGDELLAYLRIFRRDASQVQMGRIMSTVRNKGYGEMIVKEGISQAISRFDPEQILIEAQSYAIPFYERFGFTVCGEEYLEDDIPHTPMLLVCK